jgi:hypothetical protein
MEGLVADYGKREKRISFMDTDKRNADLLIRLKNDGLTKTKFFRAILSGYLDRDHGIVDFIERFKTSEGHQSHSKAAIVGGLEEKGRENKRKFGLEEKDIQNIFDILEKEHPEL